MPTSPPPPALPAHAHFHQQSHPEGTSLVLDKCHLISTDDPGFLTSKTNCPQNPELHVQLLTHYCLWHPGGVSEFPCLTQECFSFSPVGSPCATCPPHFEKGLFPSFATSGLRVSPESYLQNFSQVCGLLATPPAHHLLPGLLSPSVLLHATRPKNTHQIMSHAVKISAILCCSLDKVQVLYHVLEEDWQEEDLHTSLSLSPSP